MLLLDDDDVLAETPDQAEAALAQEVGLAGLHAIDAALVAHTRRVQSKVARVVFDAMRAGGYSYDEDSHVALHVRRVMALVATGRLEGFGDLRRPR